MILLFQAASAAPTTVCAGCPLSAAVAAAAPGDTLWLEPGVHPASSIVVDKDLEIRALTPLGANLDPGGAVAFRVADGVTLSVVDVVLSYVDGRLAEVGAGGVLNAYGLQVESSTTSVGPDDGFVTFVADGRAVLGGSRFVNVTGGGWGLVAGEGAVDVVATDLIVTGYRVAQGSCLAHVPNGSVTLTGSRIEDCRDGTSSPLKAGTATITDTTFVACATEADGGCVTVFGGATVSGGAFEDARSSGCGGAIYAAGPLTVQGTLFAHGEAGASGGAICHRGDSPVLLEDAIFDGNEALYAGFGAAVLLDLGGTHTVRRCTFTENTTSGTGGAIAAPNATSLTVDGSWFTHNDAAKGAAIASQATRLDVVGSTFCANTTVEEGAAISASSQVATLEVSESVFVQNRAVGATLHADGALVVHDVDFVDDASDSAVEIAGGTLDLTNTLFLGAAVAVAGGGSADRTSWNAFSEIGDPGVFGFGEAAVRADPQLGARGPFPTCAEYDLLPREGSPLVDAGDPTVVVDGTRSDIGAFDRPPGATTTPPTEIDADLDGFAPPVDCDDDDPTIHPGSTETRDGVDHDCDGTPTFLDLRGRTCGCGGHDIDLPSATEPTVDTAAHSAAAPLLGLLAAAVRRRRRG